MSEKLTRIWRAEYSEGFWIRRPNGSMRYVGDDDFCWRHGLTNEEERLIGQLQIRYAFGGAYAHRAAGLATLQENKP